MDRGLTAVRLCLACGGTFSPIQRDGSTYAHVCPSIRTVLVVRDGAEQRVDLVELKATDLVRVKRAGKVLDVAVGDLQADDVRVGDEFRERPNARNENPDPAKRAKAAPDTPDEDTIVSSGSGVDELPDPPRKPRRADV